MPSWTIPVRADSPRSQAGGAHSSRIRRRSIGGSGLSGLLTGSNSFETREKITAPYSESGWVHACLKPIGQAVASVPLQFWLGDPAVDKGAKLLTAKDSAIVRLFEQPNSMQTMAQFLEAGVMHRKLDGEDFWFLLDELGRPVDFDVIGMRSAMPTFILPVRGACVTPILDAIGLPRAWCFSMRGGRLVTAPTTSVIQFKDYDPDDPIRGLGDVEAAISDIDMEWQATRFQRAILKHSGDPGGQILVEQPLAPEEAEATENEANELLTVDNAGRWTVVSGKGVKYEPNKLSPKDMQFKELQMWVRDKVAGILGVPLPIIGVLDQATYSNFGQAVELFWKGGNGICSYLGSIEDVVNRVFLPRVSDPEAHRIFARFDTSHVKALQEDKTKQYEIATKIAGAGLGISLDEAMKLVGLDVDTEGMPFSNTRLVSSTLVPIESVAGPDGTGLPEEPEAPAAADGVPLPGAGTPVQDTALNGAQVSSLLEIVAAVSAGTLTPDAAVALILAAYPTISEEAARRIVGGVIEKPPEPEPAPGAPPAEDAPAEEDPPKDPPDDEEEPEEDKSAPQPSASAAPARRDAAEEAFAERRSYWAKLESASLKPGEDALKRVYLKKKGWRPKYEAAQLARLRAFADTGKGLQAAPEQRESDELGGSDKPPRHVTQAELDQLLLDAREWALKMREAFRREVESIFHTAAADMADELDANILAPTDPRVLRFLEDQLMRLSEDHTGTLANKVRDVLLEQLSKASPAGSLQEAVAEVLPELTDALKLSFADRESRALTIARTETAKAANGARFMQMGDAGVTEQEWVTSGDAAVRGTPGGPYEDAEYSHAELDGLTAPLGAEFNHSNHPGLKYPSDPDAAPGDTINCRCGSRAKRKD